MAIGSALYFAKGLLGNLMDNCCCFLVIVVSPYVVKALFTLFMFTRVWTFDCKAFESQMWTRIT